MIHDYTKDDEQVDDKPQDLCQHVRFKPVRDAVGQKYESKYQEAKPCQK